MPTSDAKVWEETWIRSNNSSCRWVVHPKEDRFSRIAEFDDDESVEAEAFTARQGDRARLAAAAPEMARLLLEAEWMAEEWDYGGGESVCGWCWSHAPYDQGHRFIGPKEQGAPRHHKPDCDFIAMLRKAGIAS